MNPAAVQLVDAMDAVSLAEIDSVALMNRVDVKYAFHDSLFPLLAERAAPAYRTLSVEGIRTSGYRTLYFDSPDFGCYIQHHNGKRNRYKVRMRQYQSSGACFLEVKVKNNRGRTVKSRMPIAAVVETLSAESKAFISSVLGACPELTPQLWTEFSRATWVHRNSPERITLDFDIRFRYESRETGVPGLAVAEVKQERDNWHTPLRSALREQRIRPLRVSKYCLGTMLLKPHLKHNRFNPTLRALRKIA